MRVDLDKLERERSKRNSVRTNIEQVLRRVDNFLMQRASGAADISYPPRLTSPLPPGRKKGESIADALLRTRRQISAEQAELLRVRTAPPTPDEIKIGIIESVDRLAKEGRPSVTASDGRVELHWIDVQMHASPGSALSAPSGSASKMLAWLFREPLLKRLLREVEGNEDGIPSADRPRLIREAEGRILGLEVAEERLVMAALEQGLECHRRIDASPWAILGFVEEAVAEAAE